jgi:cbb3-type cytochrome oxidase subunit 3
MRLIQAMEVFAVTVFVSLLFGILFAVLFVAERAQRRVRSLEQEALLPLDDTGIVQVTPTEVAGAMNAHGTRI